MKTKGFTSLEITNTKQNRRKITFLTGFTLIELLMVIAIVSLLSTVVLGQVTSVREKGRIAAGQQFDASLKHSLGDQLVGEWLFENDTATEVINTGGNKYNGVYENGIGLSDHVDGIMGRALNFDGVAEERVDLGQTSIGTEGTFSIWIRGVIGEQPAGENIYPFGVQGKHSLLGPAGGVNPRFGIISSDDGAEPHSYVDWGDQGLYDGKWHMYTVSWIGLDVYAYLDGASVGPPKQMINGSFVGTGNVHAGGGWSDTYGNHTGDIDNVRIYSKALTTAQIQKLYAEGLSTHQTLASN